MSKQSLVGNWTLQHLDTFGFEMITTATNMVKAAPILASVHLILRYQKVFVRPDLRSESQQARLAGVKGRRRLSSESWAGEGGLA